MSGAIVPRPAAIWASNKTPNTTWGAGWVVYPIKPGDPDPIITRIDSYTVAITNGAEYDVISFDTNSVVATLIVDVGATNASPTPQTTQPSFLPVAGAYGFDVSNVVVVVTSESGATVFWTTNGTTPTTASANGASPLNVTLTSPCTLKAYATNDNKTDSYITSGTYTQAAPPGTVEMPTFNPGAGTYTNAQVVTISCITTNSTIYWSTNNVAVGNLYSGNPVNITNTSTLRAYAIADGMTSSITNSDFYTINLPSLPNLGSQINSSTGRFNRIIIRRQ
jgi:hypothetical protein